MGATSYRLRDIYTIRSEKRPFSEPESPTEPLKGILTRRPPDFFRLTWPKPRRCDELGSFCSTACPPIGLSFQSRILLSPCRHNAGDRTREAHESAPHPIPRGHFSQRRIAVPSKDKSHHEYRISYSLSGRMSTEKRNGLNAYSRVGRISGVAGADPL